MMKAKRFLDASDKSFGLIVFKIELESSIYPVFGYFQEKAVYLSGGVNQETFDLAVPFFENCKGG